jgi:hypothetical protein
MTKEIQYQINKSAVSFLTYLCFELPSSLVISHLELAFDPGFSGT